MCHFKGVGELAFLSLIFGDTLILKKLYPCFSHMERRTGIQSGSNLIIF